VGFLVFFCVRDDAVTRGQCLALSRAWWCCYCCCYEWRMQDFAMGL